MGGRGRSTPPILWFFWTPPHQNWSPPMGHTPHLKMKVGGGTALSCEDWNKENIFLPLIWKVQTIWLWVVLGSWWWFWVVLVGCGWFWAIACFITNVHFLKCLNQLCWSPNKGWSIIGPYQVSIPSLTSKWKNNYLMSNSPQYVWLCLEDRSWEPHTASFLCEHYYKRPKHIIATKCKGSFFIHPISW